MVELADLQRSSQSSSKKHDMSSSTRSYLQSTVGGASLVNPGRGSTITVTWNAPTTARRRPFGFKTSSWISNSKFGVRNV